MGRCDWSNPKPTELVWTPSILQSSINFWGSLYHSFSCCPCWPCNLAEQSRKGSQWLSRYLPEILKWRILKNPFQTNVCSTSIENGFPSRDIFQKENAVPIFWDSQIASRKLSKFLPSCRRWWWSGTLGRPWILDVPTQRSMFGWFLDDLGSCPPSVQASNFAIEFELIWATGYRILWIVAAKHTGEQVFLTVSDCIIAAQPCHCAKHKRLNLTPATKQQFYLQIWCHLSWCTWLCFRGIPLIERHGNMRSLCNRVPDEDEITGTDWFLLPKTDMHRPRIDTLFVKKYNGCLAIWCLQRQQSGRIYWLCTCSTSQHIWTTWQNHKLLIPDNLPWETGTNNPSFKQKLPFQTGLVFLNHPQFH